MARTFVLCALAAVCSGLALAGEKPAPTRTVIRLNVSPMAESVPSLKYQLLPELREMQPGNPLHAYLICFMEQNHFFYNKEVVEKREKYATLPLEKLPLDELRGYGGSALKQADFAARLTTPDWQVLYKLRRDGFSLLIPEVQQMRKLAMALKVRFRAEVAGRRFDDAVRTAKTMLALSRHLGEHPTLIGALVGVAVAAQTQNTLDEMIAQPGCPNLYWALTQLPESLIDLRKAMQGERVVVDRPGAGFDDSKAMTEEQLDRLVKRVQDVEKELEPRGALHVEAWLAARVKDEAHLRAARKRLIDAGLPAERVKSFPARQVVLLDEKRDYEAQFDDVMKLMPLPHWRLEAHVRRRPFPKTVGLLSKYVPAVENVHRADGRLCQRFALLRHVEAIRLHAAAHGKLPAKLSDIEVPLPVDPFTGKAFAYEVDKGTAIIRGSPPAGMEKLAVYNVVYEVTLRK